MKYNNVELVESTSFDGVPTDMLVWNDDYTEPVIRQVVAKINSKQPWVAVLKGEHDTSEDSFGGWEHAAELPKIELMTNIQFSEFVKKNNVYWYYKSTDGVEKFFNSYEFNSENFNKPIDENIRLKFYHYDVEYIPSKYAYEHLMSKL